MKGGRCEACEGDGVKRIEMHFLADVFVPCEVCKGKRFNEATLRVRFKGKNVAEVLDLCVDEALGVFEHQPGVIAGIRTLADVGLGYLKLGQPSPTLSGGEAQRIKLSRELSRKATGRTLYILDEPTTGLHFDDMRKLLAVLDRLVEAGNTRDRDRAQPRRDQVRGLGDRPRARRRRRRRRARRDGHAGGGREERRELHGALPEEGAVSRAVVDRIPPGDPHRRVLVL